MLKSKNYLTGFIWLPTLIPIGLKVVERLCPEFKLKSNLSRQELELRHAEGLKQGPVDGVAELHRLVGDAQDVGERANHVVWDRVPLDLEKSVNTIGIRTLPVWCRAFIGPDQATRLAYNIGKPHRPTGLVN